MKRLLSILICAALCLSVLTSAFAADPNISTGGSGLGHASSSNIWYGDSGVRVTVVNAESRQPVTNSIDLIKPPEYCLAWN